MKNRKFIKNSILVCGISALFLIPAVCFAECSDLTCTITPAEQVRLNQIQYNYNQKNDVIEKRITEYTNKIDIVANDVNKTEAQKALLIGAYERNIETINAQKRQLEMETDALYKSVLGDEKYNIYKAQQKDIQDSVQNLQKNKEIKLEN